MASIYTYGTDSSGKSWTYTIPKPPDCLLCKKQGRIGFPGETFNPRLGARLPLCKRHWALWRVNVFKLPVKTRRKMVQKLRSRISTTTYDDFKALFSMFWDLLQLSAETGESKYIESFFLMKKAS